MILCCGDGFVDMLPVAGAERPSWAAHPGGAVFNTAIGLARLGAPSGLLTGLSTDGFGDMLRVALDANGVDYGLSVSTERKTTLAFVSLADGQARYSFHDEGSALRGLTSNEIPELPARVGAVFFGGISLVGEPCGSAFEAVQAAAARNRVVILDPNIRPAFIPDAAAYLARLDRMIAHSDIIKLSDEELAWIARTAQATDDPVRNLLDRGVQVVILTEGSAGATAVTRGGVSVRVSARQVDVLDTVGAGDTFNAGVLARLNELGMLQKDAVCNLGEDSLCDALEYGAAAAALAVSKRGAQPPSRLELAEMFAEHSTV